MSIHMPINQTTIQTQMHHNHAPHFTMYHNSIMHSYISKDSHIHIQIYMFTYTQSQQHKETGPPTKLPHCPHSPSYTPDLNCPHHIHVLIHSSEPIPRSAEGSSHHSNSQWPAQHSCTKLGPLTANAISCHCTWERTRPGSSNATTTFF